MLGATPGEERRPGGWSVVVLVVRNFAITEREVITVVIARSRRRLDRRPRPRVTDGGEPPHQHRAGPGGGCATGSTHSGTAVRRRRGAWGPWGGAAWRSSRSAKSARGAHRPAVCADGELECAPGTEGAVPSAGRPARASPGPTALPFSVVTGPLSPAFRSQHRRGVPRRRPWPPSARAGRGGPRASTRRWTGSSTRGPTCRTGRPRAKGRRSALVGAGALVRSQGTTSPDGGRSRPAAEPNG